MFVFSIVVHFTPKNSKLVVKERVQIMEYAKLDPYRSAVAFCFETFFGAV